MADRYDKSGQGTEAKHLQMRAALLKFWDDYMAVAGPMTLDQYIDGHKKFGKAEFRKMIANFYSIFFDSVDFDGKGVIGLREFTIYFTHIMGLDPLMAVDTFAAIDTNRDGKLTRAEYLASADDFFTGEDVNSPNRLFWGPLL